MEMNIVHARQSERSRFSSKTFDWYSVAEKHDWRTAMRIKTTAMGRGLFARKTFRKRQAIGIMAGRLVVDDDYDPDYVVDMGDLGVLEPKAPFRYLNHSCEPNCELVEWEEADGSRDTRIWVHALRTVRPSDELTIDYGWPADSAIPCLCGTTKCRGWVVDVDQLGAVERRARARR
jgi:hypothetical protein